MLKAPYAHVYQNSTTAKAIAGTTAGVAPVSKLEEAYNNKMDTIIMNALKTNWRRTERQNRARSKLIASGASET